MKTVKEVNKKINELEKAYEKLSELRGKISTAEFDNTESVSIKTLENYSVDFSIILDQILHDVLKLENLEIKQIEGDE